MMATDSELKKRVDEIGDAMTIASMMIEPDQDRVAIAIGILIVAVAKAQLDAEDLRERIEAIDARHANGDKKR